jgi:hypothetical protein
MLLRDDFNFRVRMSDKTEGKGQSETSTDQAGDRSINRRNILLGTSTLVAAATLTSGALYFST